MKINNGKKIKVLNKLLVGKKFLDQVEDPHISLTVEKIILCNKTLIFYIKIEAFTPIIRWGLTTIKDKIEQFMFMFFNISIQYYKIQYHESKYGMKGEQVRSAMSNQEDTYSGA